MVFTSYANPRISPRELIEQPKRRDSEEPAGTKVFRSVATPCFQIVAVRAEKSAVIEDPTTSSLSFRAMAMLLATPGSGFRSCILPFSLFQRKAWMVALSDSEE